MKWTDLVDRAPALKAIEEFDRLGREAFLQKHGFGPSTRLFVRANDKLYDIKALAGVTWGYAFPDRGALKNVEFSSGRPIVSLFRRLGFDVVDQSDASTLASAREFRAALESLLSGLLVDESRTVDKTSPMSAAMNRAVAALRPLVREYPHIVVEGSLGAGNRSEIPWIALLDDRETTSTMRGVYLVYLFRADMTGVYLTLNQGVSDLKKDHGWPTARQKLVDTASELRARYGERLRGSFSSADGIELRGAKKSGGLAAGYEAGTVAWTLYETGALPPEERLVDHLHLLLDAYDDYVDQPAESQPAATGPTQNLGALVAALRARGFVCQPWQVAAFITALRTKPFVILAGISGTGKSRLPLLVAELTGVHVEMIPVRPDWTDSADLIGYSNLKDAYVPGRLLEVASRAMKDPARLYMVVLDEMNLARVEQYFAEVLSLIEDRVVVPDGGFESRTFLAPSAASPWNEVGIPRNLVVVGTVNMDETTHGFSRKVLDRAFTLEMSEVDLTEWRRPAAVESLAAWSPSSWHGRALRPGDLADVDEGEIKLIARTIQTLQHVNRLLSPAQLQVGYRVRDEIAMFLIHAAREADSFVGTDGAPVDALDLALNMKVLPRIQGGSSAIRTVLRSLVGWAHAGKDVVTDDDARAIAAQWAESGRSATVAGAHFPRTLARLCLMWERLQTDSFTSYWL